MIGRTNAQTSTGSSTGPYEGAPGLIIDKNSFMGIDAYSMSGVLYAEVGLALDWGHTSPMPSITYTEFTTDHENSVDILDAYGNVQAVGSNRFLVSMHLEYAITAQDCIIECSVHFTFGGVKGSVKLDLYPDNYAPLKCTFKYGDLAIGIPVDYV